MALFGNTLVANAKKQVSAIAAPIATVQTATEPKPITVAPQIPDMSAMAVDMPAPTNTAAAPIAPIPEPTYYLNQDKSITTGAPPPIPTANVSNVIDKGYGINPVSGLANDAPSTVKPTATAIQSPVAPPVDIKPTSPAPVQVAKQPMPAPIDVAQPEQMGYYGNANPSTKPNVAPPVERIVEGSPISVDEYNSGDTKAYRDAHTFGNTDGAPSNVDPATATPFQQKMDTLNAQYAKWSTETSDPVFSRVFNQMVTDTALMNSADRDALQMRINQDPSLKGQGAGNAMLQVMSRDQNFNLDHAIGKLSSESAQRILELNKYGFEGIKNLMVYQNNVDTARREELYKAGDYDGFAKNLKDTTGATFSPEAIQNLKQMSPANQETLSALLKAGDIDGYARQLDESSGGKAKLSPEAIRNMKAMSPAEKAKLALLMTSQNYDGLQKEYKDMFGVDLTIAQIKSMDPSTKETVSVLGDTMNNLIKAGKMEQAKATYAAMQALQPNVFTSSFEDFVTEKQAYLMKSEADKAVTDSIREQISKGQISEAMDGMDAFYDTETQFNGGNDLISGLSLDEINTKLKAAGLDPVTDKSELIGRETDVFKANEISKSQGEMKTDIIGKETQQLKEMLAGQGYDLTDPASEKALRSYVMDLYTSGGLKYNETTKLFTIDPNTLVPPWDPKSTSAHLFSDWPILKTNPDGSIIRSEDNGTPTVIYGGGIAYNEKTNPEANPSSATFAYEQDLNKKWESYVASNTDATKRLSRNDWFMATLAGTQDVNTKSSSKTGTSTERSGTYNSDLKGLITVDKATGTFNLEGITVPINKLTSEEWTMIANNSRAVTDAKVAGIINDKFPIKAGSQKDLDDAGIKVGDIISYNGKIYRFTGSNVGKSFGIWGQDLGSNTPDSIVEFIKNPKTTNILQYIGAGSIKDIGLQPNQIDVPKNIDVFVPPVYSPYSPTRTVGGFL